MSPSFAAETGRCTLGFAFASLSSFLRLASVFPTFQAQQIARWPHGMLVGSRLPAIDCAYEFKTQVGPQLAHEFREYFTAFQEKCPRPPPLCPAPLTFWE